MRYTIVTILQLAIIIMTTGVGSMGAPGAGAPMKFLSGIHTKSYFALKCFFILSISVDIGTRAPVYQNLIVFLRL